MIDIGLTHIALPVSNVDRTIEFYAKYAAVHPVLSPLAHLGVGCKSREYMDEICDQARQLPAYPVGSNARLGNPAASNLTQRPLQMQLGTIALK